MRDKFSNQFATQRLRTETSMTSAGPGSAGFTPGPIGQPAPRATKKVVKKKLRKEERDVEPKLAAGKSPKIPSDWTDAPSIPNRPSKGGFIYKQLFESQEEKDQWTNKEVEIVKGEYAGNTGEVIGAFIEEGNVKLDVKINALGNPVKIVNAKDVEVIGQLQENYSRFKKETRTRTNEQQLHAAMRLAEKKIHEANRILEYTAQLRTELTETRVNKNTQRLMEKITRGIAEAYGKMKKLK